jgi:hypothetical protein
VITRDEHLPPVAKLLELTERPIVGVISEGDKIPSIG